MPQVEELAVVVHPLRDAGQQAGQALDPEVQVAHQHEVDRPCRLPVGDVAHGPGDVVSRATFLTYGDTDVGPVDGLNSPACLGQPTRVSATTAAEVNGVPWLKA